MINFLRIILFSLMAAMLPESSRGAIVGRWELNGNAADSSGRSHDGVIHFVSPAADRAGSPNQAMSFDGGSVIVIPDHPDFDLSNDFTISCWVKPAGTPPWGSVFTLVSKHMAGPNFDGTWSMVMANPDNLVVMGGTPFFDNGSIASPPAPAGAWIHIAYTYSKSTSVWNFYLNGQLSSTGFRAYELRRNTQPLRIGAQGHPSYSSGLAHYFQGTMDDLRIYDQCLAFTEIRSENGFGQNGASWAALPADEAQLAAALNRFKPAASDVHLDSSGLMCRVDTPTPFHLHVLQKWNATLREWIDLEQFYPHSPVINVAVPRIAGENTALYRVTEAPPLPGPRFRLPFDGGTWKVTTSIGDSSLDSHSGINFHSLDFSSRDPQGVPIADVPVLAVADGVVVVAANDPFNGNYVVLAHDHPYQNGVGLSSRYLHLREFPTLPTGRYVPQGQKLGIMGATGTDAVHLHLGFRYGGSGAQEIEELQQLKLETHSLSDFEVETRYPSTNLLKP